IGTDHAHDVPSLGRQTDVIDGKARFSKYSRKALAFEQVHGPARLASWKGTETRHADRPSPPTIQKHNTSGPAKPAARQGMGRMCQATRIISRTTGAGSRTAATCAGGRDPATDMTNP